MIAALLLAVPSTALAHGADPDVLTVHIVFRPPDAAVVDVAAYREREDLWPDSPERLRLLQSVVKNLTATRGAIDRIENPGARFHEVGATAHLTGPLLRKHDALWTATVSGESLHETAVDHELLGVRLEVCADRRHITLTPSPRPDPNPDLAWEGCMVWERLAATTQVEIQARTREAATSTDRPILLLSIATAVAAIGVIAVAGRRSLRRRLPAK